MIASDFCLTSNKCGFFSVMSWREQVTVAMEIMMYTLYKNQQNLSNVSPSPWVDMSF